MKNVDNMQEVTRVSNGFNCDGMEIITYFSGGKEIAKEILCDNGMQLVMTGRIPEGRSWSITGQEHCDVSLRMQTIKLMAIATHITRMAQSGWNKTSEWACSMAQ